MRHLRENFDQLWKAAWRVGDWKRSLSWRLFWWEQQPWQMGQLNHCGNGVLDGWLWISGGHRVAVSHVSELSEEFSTQCFETPSSQVLDTDKTGGCDPWSLWSMRPKRMSQVVVFFVMKKNKETLLSVQEQKLEKGWILTKDNNFA